jgi:hypothetical protein
MKDCPFKIEDCETCRWNFGPHKCGIFSIATDMSVIAEESVKQTKLLETLVTISKNSGRG